jgi:putative Mg2+ transporter-C (MgtC) family protein
MVEGVAELGWLEMVGRLALACLLGGLLGLEREYDGQDAGFRTHLLVVLGSALFGVLSVGAWHEFVAARNDTNVNIDITRIAAYVAPGVGFIGGGAILKHGGRVSGITTAASLWAAAAIGVGCGLGMWVLAAATTLFALVALQGLKPLSKKVAAVGKSNQTALIIEVTEDIDRAHLNEALAGALRGDVKELRFGSGPEYGEIHVEYWHDPSDPEIVDSLDRLRAIDGVRSVRFEAARSAAVR